MTQQELFEKYVHFYHLEENYVYLKEDENGKYIEYVYKEGVPHDNRCLSSLDKMHTANTNTVYKLWEFSCGLQDKEGDEKCTAGHPKKGCPGAANWTYKKPMKCACWTLATCDFKFSIIGKDIEQFSKFILCN